MSHKFEPQFQEDGPILGTLRRWTASFADAIDTGTDGRDSNVSPLPPCLAAIFSGRRQVRHFCLFYGVLLSVTAALFAVVVRRSAEDDPQPE